MYRRARQFDRCFAIVIHSQIVGVTRLPCILLLVTVVLAEALEMHCVDANTDLMKDSTGKLSNRASCSLVGAILEQSGVLPLRKVQSQFWATLR
jgi:hypothetical protein